MTADDIMTLCAVLEKSSDVDPLPEMMGFTAERLIARRSSLLPAPLTESGRWIGSTTATATGTASGRPVPARSR